MGGYLRGFTRTTEENIADYAELSVVGNAVATAIASASTFVQFAGFDTNGQAQGATPDHTNDHITIARAGVYRVMSSISFDKVAAGPITAELEVQINNGATPFTNLHAHRQIGGPGAIGHVSISGFALLAINDTVELWIQNLTDTNNLLLIDVNLSIEQAGALVQ